MKKKYFEWSTADKQVFDTTGELDLGKWQFFRAPNGQYEAVMHGIYMHVFSTLKEMLYRDNEIAFYEYCEIESEERGETTFVNSDGEIRNYGK